MKTVVTLIADGRGLAYGGPVLAMTRLSEGTVPPVSAGAVGAAAADVLAALAVRPGFRSGRVGRLLDDPTGWVLASEWDDVGSYRRGLSAYDVKIAFAALMPYVLDEPSAYEVVARVESGAAPAAGPE